MRAIHGALKKHQRIKTMKNAKKKTFIQNKPILSAIIAGVVLYFITSLLDTIINKKKFVDGMWDVLKAIGVFFWNILIFGIPVWIILILLLVALVLIRFINNTSIDTTPSWKNYTEDNIKEWRFAWSYTHRTNLIDNLRPICKNCSCELSYKTRINSEYGYGDFLVCPNCNSIFRVPNESDKQDVTNLIIHRATQMEKRKFNPK
jgi:hypothetical protein